MTASVTGVGRLYSSALTAVGLLVHSNLFVSVSATSVAVTTVLLTDLPLEPLPLFIVFAATLFVYSFNRITDIAEDEENVPSRARFTRRYGKTLLAVGVTLYVAAFAVALAIGVRGAPFLALPLIVGIVYSVYAKRLLLVKNLVVGAAWGAIPLGVGVYYGAVSSEILYLAVFFGVEITAAAALFDIKDIEGDRREGIRTVPNVHGPRATRLAALGVVAALVPAVFVASHVFGAEYLVLLGFLGYVAGYVPFARRDRGPLFYGFVIDGEHVFLAALVAAVEVLS